MGYHFKCNYCDGGHAAPPTPRECIEGEVLCDHCSSLIFIDVKDEYLISLGERLDAIDEMFKNIVAER